jgi:hypothetical protein
MGFGLVRFNFGRLRAKPHESGQARSVRLLRVRIVPAGLVPLARAATLAGASYLGEEPRPFTPGEQVFGHLRPQSTALRSDGFVVIVGDGVGFLRARQRFE